LIAHTLFDYYAKELKRNLSTDDIACRLLRQPGGLSGVSAIYVSSHLYILLKPLSARNARNALRVRNVKNVTK